MNTQEQDKRWQSLNDEAKSFTKEIYLRMLIESNPDKITLELITKIENEYGSHNLQPKLTYEDVLMKLFNQDNIPVSIVNLNPGIDDIIGTSQQQVKKLFAINKLLNCAKFLNKNEDGSDWKPDWENECEVKWFFKLIRGQLTLTYTCLDNYSLVYFRDEFLIKKAVEILGESIIITALGWY